MRYRRFAMLLAGWLALGLGATAAEPSIEDMLKEVEAKAHRPAATGPGVGEPAAESEYLRSMKARLQYEVDQRARGFTAKNDYVGMGNLYFDLQRWNEALASWNTATQKLPNDWQVSQGRVHQSLCKVYTLLGQTEMAAQAVEEATRRIPGPWMNNDLDRLRDWLKNFPDRDKEAKVLKAKFAGDPKDMESRWKQLVLYRNDVPMRLDEFVGLIQFRDMYPKDQRVAVSGECDWRLMEVLMHFGLADEGMGMAEKFREKFPKSGLSTGGEVCWRLADWSGRLGRPQDAVAYYRELREKYQKHWAITGGEAVWRMGETLKSLKRWQEALECYKEVRDKYTKHWSCNPPPGQQATIQERIFEATKNGAR